MIRRHLSDLAYEYTVLYGLSISARYEELKITEKDRDKALTIFLSLEAKINALKTH